MKIKLMLISLLIASNGVNAASCLTANEKSKVDRIHKNSLDSYDYVKIDCQQPKLKMVCSDPYNVKMINVMMRFNVWDEENALKYEYSAKDLDNLKKNYSKTYTNTSCAIIKKDFKRATSSNGGWDY